MSGVNSITSAALVLALGLGLSGGAAARDGIPDGSQAAERDAGDRHFHPRDHARGRHHRRGNAIPYAFGMNPVYVYSQPYVSVYSAPFSPGTLHFVEPGQVTVIQPMAWE